MILQIHDKAVDAEVKKGIAICLYTMRYLRAGTVMYFSLCPIFGNTQDW